MSRRADAGLAAPFAQLAAAVRDATAVVAIGGGTHVDVGGPVTGAVEVRAPAGIVDFQPADMTVAVLAGTTVADLAAALAERGQECPLDPVDPDATVGGTIAAGLSGPRRLGLGPLRDTVLEVVVILADGRIVRGGGPTVKNVTGYDFPRLAVGSLGTLGVIGRVTLRTRPLPAASAWFRSDLAPPEILTRLFAPTAVLADATGSHVLLEGHPADLGAEAARGELRPARPPTLPSGRHRGRISVPPNAVAATSARLRTLPASAHLAEHGVGTVHVASDDPGVIAAARDIAHAHAGWLLREAGAPGIDPFGCELPAAGLQRRIRAALDPTGKLAPGRVPTTEPTRTAA